MSEIFGSYPENMGTVSKSANDFDIRRKDIKKLIKSIRKLCKAEKRTRKILQQVHRQWKMEEMPEKNTINGQETCADKDGEERNAKKNTQKEEKSFFNRIGDALLKALPSIFRTVTSIAATIVFGFISQKFGIQRRTAHAAG